MAFGRRLGGFGKQAAECHMEAETTDRRVRALPCSPGEPCGAVPNRIGEAQSREHLKGPVGAKPPLLKCFILGINLPEREPDPHAMFERPVPNGGPTRA